MGTSSSRGECRDLILKSIFVYGSKLGSAIKKSLFLPPAAVFFFHIHPSEGLITIPRHLKH